MIIAMCILLSAYVIMMVYLIVGWLKAVRQSRSKNYTIDTHASLTALIPFRNEESNLPLLLADLSSMAGDISQLRILLIDDHSSDSSRDTIRPWLDSELDVRLVSNSGEGKVAALNTGLREVDTEYIITLDADIRLGQGWYEAIKSLLGIGLDMCILPVLGTADDSLSGKYAQLDFMSLIGVTFAMAAHDRPVMANGAQLLIKKDQASWKENVVSGDDVFALHHIKKERGEISFRLYPDLVARTAMPNTWNAVWSQRLRWASKAGGYKDRDTLLLGWVVLAVHVGLWVLFFWSLIQSAALSLFLIMLLTKFMLDLALLIPVMHWFDQGARLFLFPFAFIINLIQYPLVFLAGRLRGFTWKNRNYQI
jgi:biofilm PGA synthesis N-glycosyltransferase PgaC